MWAEHERLRAENQDLWQAWAEAQELSEAKQREVAASGSAMGLSLTQVVTVLAIVLPWGVVPSRATVGRWVQQAAVQAGHSLEVLDRACQARVLALCLDEIFFHREPILMGIEPDSLVWVAGQRGPDRSGESWRQVLEQWPCLEHVIADGGRGLERGVKLANEARSARAQASASVSPVAITMGLDSFHPQRELERALRGVEKRAEHQLETASQADAKVAQATRHGRDTRGMAGAAGRAWRKAEALFNEAVQAHEAVEQIQSALSWFDAKGTLYSRQTAQAQLDEAMATLQDACWGKAKRLLSDARALSHLDRLNNQLALAVPEPRLREALTYLWYLRQAMRGAAGDERVRLESLAVMAQVLCDRLGGEWTTAYEQVKALLRQAVRASSAVEGVNSVVRMHQGRHRQGSQGMLDLKRLYWNCRLVRDGKRKGHCPYELLGVTLPTSNWWELLQMDPKELEHKLSTQ